MGAIVARAHPVPALAFDLDHLRRAARRDGAMSSSRDAPSRLPMHQQCGSHRGSFIVSSRSALSLHDTRHLQHPRPRDNGIGPATVARRDSIPPRDFRSEGRVNTSLLCSPVNLPRFSGHPPTETNPRRRSWTVQRFTTTAANYRDPQGGPGVIARAMRSGSARLRAYPSRPASLHAISPHTRCSIPM